MGIRDAAGYRNPHFALAAILRSQLRNNGANDRQVRDFGKILQKLAPIAGQIVLSLMSRKLLD
jgi:hypothetical protein